MNDDFTFARRKAYAALDQALSGAGIPGDYLILPHQDDHNQLQVVSDNEIRWQYADNGLIRATVYFFEDLTGEIQGHDIHNVTESRDFYAEDYGFDRPFQFALPFDLTDVSKADLSAWRELPKVTLKRSARPFQPKVISSR